MKVNSLGSSAKVTNNFLWYPFNGHTELDSNETLNAIARALDRRSKIIIWYATDCTARTIIRSVYAVHPDVLQLIFF